MTNPISLGRALGEAASRVQKLHHQAMADVDIDFPTWMFFTLLRESPEPPTEQQIATELDRRMDLTEPETRAVLEQALADGFVTRHDDGRVSLTTAGSEHFAAVYAHARSATDAATAGIEQDKIDTAIAVLQAVYTRANTILATKR
jgi:DNA-binding MarR family transcriptional regulator